MKKHIFGYPFLAILSWFASHYFSGHDFGKIPTYGETHVGIPEKIQHRGMYFVPKPMACEGPFGDGRYPYCVILFSNFKEE
jgi:hypothetical protein